VVSAAQWQVLGLPAVPEDWVLAVSAYLPGVGAAGKVVYAAQLLWQRNIRSVEQLAGFLDPLQYQPTSAFAFGPEMEWAVARLVQAREQGERVAIWGDFDADGVTSTAVLWDGLGQFFVPDLQLSYFIPNRLNESHGLSIRGLDSLHQQGVRLIVTCDTGSTNLKELAYAQSLGIDVIVTDHHTLPTERPDLVAIINPRYFEPLHPLAHLSGVAVAYKLVEALYETLPEVPERPLYELTDLVAIGLIADLVQLKGDCRYLAQVGIQQLQAVKKQYDQYQAEVKENGAKADASVVSRPGVAKLLELCRRTGDRPTDISFGLGPRINAVSRIHGDAHFCVELLTSRNVARCNELAQQTELANARRKVLQQDLLKQVTRQLETQDLSTTSVIVCGDAQWPTGILGIVAGQIAQTYGKPTILLTFDEAGGMAKGSARSVNQIDLYQLVAEQSHLLEGFGGHPFAAGLSLRLENLPIFADAINRQLRQSQALSDAPTGPVVQADLTVSVCELGKDLFRQLNLLEPCGMGNPVVKLLIQNCWFENPWHQNIFEPGSSRKLAFIKASFLIRDETAAEGFPGVWWEHYKDDLPPGRCHVIAELDFNSYPQKKPSRFGGYEIRIIDVRAVAPPTPLDQALDQALDLALDDASDQATRQEKMSQVEAHSSLVPELIDHRQSGDTELASANLVLDQCPTDWADLRPWIAQAAQLQQPLVLAYGSPPARDAQALLTTLLGLAKYLSRTQTWVTAAQLQDKLQVSSAALEYGLQVLNALGFATDRKPDGIQITYQRLPDASQPSDTAMPQIAIEQFLKAIHEEDFRKQYFHKVPISAIKRTNPSGYTL
jgi:single-stranded-DNA-specific exonuclease